MPNNVFAAALGITALFLGEGALIMGFSLLVQAQMNDKPTNGNEAVRNLLFQMFPLQAGVVNGAFVIAAAAFTVLGLMSPARRLLKAAGYGVVLCGVFTLCLGVYMWVMTLRLKDGFFPTYSAQDSTVQSLMQQTFTCCGYYNSTTPAFITDATCPSPAAAVLNDGCGAPIASFSNGYIDTLFTALFGMVGIDAMLILAIACLLKDRKERERYRHIDEKSGYSQF